MRRVAPIGISLLILGATVVIAWVAWNGEFDAQRRFTLGALLAVELYIAGLMYFASRPAKGDAVSAAPAVVAVVPISVTSFVGLFVNFGALLGTVLYVFGWVAALIVLLVVLKTEADHRQRSASTPSRPDFTIEEGSA